MAQCPCGSGADFDECCGPIIGDTPAPTPEALMRSRFAAYVHGDLDHIENTHAKEVRDSFNRSAAESTAKSVEWVNLEIRSTADGGENDDTGTVEFAARFKKDGELQVHHERSSFRREEGRWVYVDGQMNPKGEPLRVEKVGRNEPCPCGSGKKYKKCCGA
ncbi:MAG: YchJ family metal-binding protein [Rhodospirillales bacterium]|jgi:SEC-C motif-containing protein|nr:YchJ family metal-binding protein [Rhodospirillales bacterium]